VHALSRPVDERPERPVARGARGDRGRRLGREHVFVLRHRARRGAAHPRQGCGRGRPDRDQLAHRRPRATAARDPDVRLARERAGLRRERQRARGAQSRRAVRRRRVGHRGGRGVLRILEPHGRLHGHAAQPAVLRDGAARDGALTAPLHRRERALARQSLRMQRLVRAAAAFAVAAVVAFSPAAVRAGTTGTIVGRIIDQDTNAPLEGARVGVTSPSQNASSLTDAAGGFRFLSLNPDTYTVTVERNGYDILSLAGVTVQADQTVTLNRALPRHLIIHSRIGSTRARGSADLIRAGTTSDVYSVSGAYQDTSQALGGPGGLTNAYAAIQSVPGANVQQGQQGWFQTLSIRGGDIDQVGYELDGIPTNRVYDNAPQTMLSNLGQQELQVYTGGTPASSDASSISGYVNQVIRTGTYPGFKTLQLGIGSPQLFNKGQIEFGGANPARTFSYYGGVAQATQAFRYIDQYNGASDPRFFYPLVIDSNRFNVYDAAPVDNVAVFPNAFGPGQTYGIAGTNDREAVLNLHVAI